MCIRKLVVATKCKQDITIQSVVCHGGKIEGSLHTQSKRELVCKGMALLLPSLEVWLWRACLFI